MSITPPPVEILPDPCPLIHGKHVADPGGGEHQHVYAATGTATRVVRLAGNREVDAAVRSAREALTAWRGIAVDRRRELLLRLAATIRAHGEELTAIQIVESAVPHRYAAAFPALAADHVEYNAGWVDKLVGEVIPTWPRPGFDYATCEPYGVIGMVATWNAALPAIGQLLSAALAAGNTVVLKPSELAPFVALRLGELMLKAGFPEGVVNVIPAAADGGAALVRHPGIDKIHFTGSARTARKVLAESLDNITPATLELGGKSPLIIFEDADVAGAVQHALSAAIVLSGQGCANSTRVIVHSSLYDRILRLVGGLARRIALGDPFDKSTIMGPVISEAACDRIIGTITRAKLSGAGRLLAGGERLGGALASGYFIAPTLFADVDNDSELAQEEIFGPVVCIASFDTEQAAVKFANNSRYGLAAYIYTNDLRRAHRVGAALDVGNVWVNGLDIVAPSIPFGGIKQSGYGRLGGQSGIREFTRIKNVWLAMNT